MLVSLYSPSSLSIIAKGIAAIIIIKAITATAIKGTAKTPSIAIKITANVLILYPPIRKGECGMYKMECTVQ